MTDGMALMKAFKFWCGSGEAQKCLSDTTPVVNPYLKNRIEMAFQAGWHAALREPQNSSR